MSWEGGCVAEWVVTHVRGQSEGGEGSCATRCASDGLGEITMEGAEPEAVSTSYTSMRECVATRCGSEATAIGAGFRSSNTVAAMDPAWVT